MTATPPDYPALVAQAEQAVASVKDPELKRIAFQKVLDDLLAPVPESSVRSKPAAPEVKRKTPATRRRAARGGTQAYLDELVEEDFFKKPKTIANVKAELENRGHHIPLTSLSGPLQRLCQRKVLRRQKINASGKKQAFAYSNW
jgi:hypothetical protein